MFEYHVFDMWENFMCDVFIENWVAPGLNELQ